MLWLPRSGDDVWIPSVCGMCPDGCGILVHRVDGVVTKIEGNPQSPLGEGRLCARGLAGIQLLYDPYRLNQPLKRGNPEKGIGVDPRWQPISWDEALEAVVERLKQVRAEDPRRLLFCGALGGVELRPERVHARLRQPQRLRLRRAQRAPATLTPTSASTCSRSAPTASAAPPPGRWPTPACEG